jgi:hypothetical protein
MLRWMTVPVALNLRASKLSKDTVGGSSLTYSATGLLLLADRMLLHLVRNYEFRGGVFSTSEDSLARHSKYNTLLRGYFPKS